MATLTQGYVKLQMDTASSGGPTWTDFPGVLNVSGGGLSENLIDATDFDTEAGTREYLSGPRESQPFTFDFHYEQGNTVQEAAFAAEAGNVDKKFRVKFGTGGTAKGVVFSSVPSFSLAAPVDGKVTYSGSLRPLAAPVRGTAS